MISTDVWPGLAVKVLPVPSLSVAPAGISLIKSDDRLLSPLAEAVIFKGMGLPSSPFTSPADTVGARG